MYLTLFRGQKMYLIFKRPRVLLIEGTSTTHVFSHHPCAAVYGGGGNGACYIDSVVCLRLWVWRGCGWIAPLGTPVSHRGGRYIAIGL